MAWIPLGQTDEGVLWHNTEDGGYYLDRPSSSLLGGWGLWIVLGAFLFVVVASVVGGGVGKLAEQSGAQNTQLHTGYIVTAPNELSPAFINMLLAQAGSPAQGDGQVIYDLGTTYGLDDIYFPAWYKVETGMGTSGVARVNNPTGMECSDLADSCTGADGNGRNWGVWHSREAGFEAWFKQIKERYVSGLIDGGYPLTTVYLIACGPNGTGIYDSGSGCHSYAATIEHLVDTWRSQLAQVQTQAQQASTSSHQVTRISQLDCDQYASQQQCDTWAYSACSTAAMTEVLNAYGHQYRIADILAVEANIGAITPWDGLTHDGGIAETMAHFGFTTNWGHARSLDQVIATAHNGTPVIVGWPPQLYAGGHLLVVTGGDGQNVFLADSSSYNRRVLSRWQFSEWWAGASWVATPA